MRGYHHSRLSPPASTFTAEDFGATRAGYRTDEDGGHTFYAVFPASVGTRGAIERLEDVGIDTGRYYGGPGQYFQHAAHARLSGSRILVTIRGGRDI